MILIVEITCIIIIIMIVVLMMLMVIKEHQITIIITITKIENIIIAIIVNNTDVNIWTHTKAHFFSKTPELVSPYKA